MSKPSRIIAAIALLATGVAGGLYLHTPVVAQDREKPRDKAAATKWEYRIIVVRQNAEGDGEKELNKLGEEGYEIAFVTGGQITRELGPRGGGGESSPVFHYTLKRAKK